MPGQKAYAWAGVDIDEANETKRRIKQSVQSTFGPEVLTDLGGFGGLFAPAWKDFHAPVLVASTDGVGTKLKIAFQSGIHDSVGADLVSHCANDILVQGARPLFFLDYLAMGRHDSNIAEAVIRGVADGCKRCGCALLGGEMAEMPDFYDEGEYDLAGTIVGIVDRAKVITGEMVAPGDVLIGLASDGLHTNGYSLARKLLFKTAGYTMDSYVEELASSVGDALLAPHRPYVDPIHAVLSNLTIKGMAHITGGGLVDNVPRSLPAGTAVTIDRSSWQVPPIFGLLQRIGKIDEAEMYQDFNMGVGFVLIVSPKDADATLDKLKSNGETAFIMGNALPATAKPKVSFS